MSNLDKMGADTLKELQSEESDIRIADIFHDVARGQHLTVFRDYTRRLFPKGPFRELDHHKMFNLLQVQWLIYSPKIKGLDVILNLSCISEFLQKKVDFPIKNDLLSYRQQF